MSKEKAIKLTNQLARINRAIDRLQQEREIVSNALELINDRKCWSCPHTGQTTDLTPCEIGNKNYPRICEVMEKSDGNS